MWDLGYKASHSTASVTPRSQAGLKGGWPSLRSWRWLVTGTFKRACDTLTSALRTSRKRLTLSGPAQAVVCILLFEATRLLLIFLLLGSLVYTLIKVITHFV